MDDKIQWCIEQKRGIELIHPNENLAKAYLLKAEHALQSMVANRGNTEWEISSAYYAMYFSVYAILMRIGIKSEIHTCTIEFMRVYLKDHYTSEEIELFSMSQEARIDTQYYVGKNVNTKIQAKIVNMAPDIVVKSKETLLKIKDAEIQMIREDIDRRLKRQ